MKSTTKVHATPVWTEKRRHTDGPSRDVKLALLTFCARHVRDRVACAQSQTYRLTLASADQQQHCTYTGQQYLDVSVSISLSITVAWEKYYRVHHIARKKSEHNVYVSKEVHVWGRSRTYIPVNVRYTRVVQRRFLPFAKIIDGFSFRIVIVRVGEWDMARAMVIPHLRLVLYCCIYWYTTKWHAHTIVN